MKKIHESACDVKAMYRVTNEITGRKQPPELPECSDSHEDLAERFRVYFSEKIMNVRSTMHCRDAPPSMQPIGNNHHQLCTLSSFTPTTAAAIVRLVNKCPSKCCALDPWPTTLLKTNIDIIVCASGYHQRVIRICNCTCLNEACAGHAIAQEDRSGRK